LENLGVNGRIFKLDLEGTGLETVACICFVQDKDQWLAVVNLVMNLEVL
jgi:hypothetical protein